MWIKNVSKSGIPILVNLVHQDSVEVATESGERGAQISIIRFQNHSNSYHSKVFWRCNDPEGPDRDVKVMAVMDQIAKGLAEGLPLVDLSK